MDADLVTQASSLKHSSSFAITSRSPIHRRSLSASRSPVPSQVEQSPTNEEDVLEGEKLIMSNISLPRTTEQRAAEYIDDPKFQQILQQKRETEGLEEVLWRYEAEKRVDKAMTMDLKEELQKFVKQFIHGLDETRQKRLGETAQTLTGMTIDEDLINIGKIIIGELSGYRVQVQEILQRIHEAICAMKLSGEVKRPGWIKCRTSLMEAKNIAVDELLDIAEGMRRISLLLSDRKHALVYKSKAKGSKRDYFIGSRSIMTTASL